MSKVWKEIWVESLRTSGSFLLKYGWVFFCAGFFTTSFLQWWYQIP